MAASIHMRALNRSRSFRSSLKMEGAVPNRQQKINELSGAAGSVPEEVNVKKPSGGVC